MNRNQVTDDNKDRKLCPQCRIQMTQVGEFWICPMHGQMVEPQSFGSLRIFLSYGHDRNEELVRRIKADLENRGHDAWVVQHCDYLIAAWDGKEIGGNPAVLSHKDLKGKLKKLPDPRKEGSYTDDARPGGTWEAIRWWLDPAVIPESMQWSSHWNPICADNERAPEDRLFLIGAGVTAEGMNAGEEQ